MFGSSQRETGVDPRHQILTRWNKNIVCFLYQTDSLLYDLPPEVTLEEVNSFIALEHGQAMLVNVRRADGEVLCKCYWLPYSS